jgi:hypothetical protein
MRENLSNKRWQITSSALQDFRNSVAIEKEADKIPYKEDLAQVGFGVVSTIVFIALARAGWSSDLPPQAKVAASSIFAFDSFITGLSSAVLAKAWSDKANIHTSPSSSNT